MDILPTVKHVVPGCISELAGAHVFAQGKHMLGQGNVRAALSLFDVAITDMQVPGRGNSACGALATHERVLSCVCIGVWYAVPGGKSCVECGVNIYIYVCKSGV